MEITSMFNIALLGAIAALAVSALSAVVTWSIQRKRKETAPTLEDKITALTENLKSSLSVISEIEAEIEKRSEIVEKLRDDVQRYERLKQLSQSQVEAIAQTIRGEMAGESRKSLWRNAIITFVVSLIFFFLGFWLRGV